MDFKEQINLFADRINVLRENISTEEATKTSIILPFFKYWDMMYLIPLSLFQNSLLIQAQKEAKK